MSHLFQFVVSPWELIVRGTLIYWGLFLLFRFILRRDAGSIGLADILIIVLIADAAQNGMAGDYKTIAEALVLIGTLAFWNYTIDWMSLRYRWWSRFAEPAAVALIRHGAIIPKNLQSQMLTVEDVESQLRQHGIDDLAIVKHALLEPDGHISVIKYAIPPLKQ